MARGGFRGSWQHGRHLSFFDPVGQFHSGVFSIIVAAQDRGLCGIGIVRADGAVGASVLAVGVVDARRGIRAAVFSVGVRDGIGGIGISTQAAEILTVCGDDFRGRGGVGIRDAGGGVGIAESSEGIVDADARIGTAERAELVRRGIGEERVRAELAEKDAVAADLRGGA